MERIQNYPFCLCNTISRLKLTRIYSSHSDFERLIENQACGTMDSAAMYDRCKQSIINMLRKHIFEHRLFTFQSFNDDIANVSVTSTIVIDIQTRRLLVGLTLCGHLKITKNIICIQISSLFWQPRRKFQTYCIRAPCRLSAHVQTLTEIFDNLTCLPNPHESIQPHEVVLAAV